jgi:hypothetical protein
MKENQRAKHQKDRNRKIRKLVKLQINHGTEKPRNGMIETERTKECKRKKKESKPTKKENKQKKKESKRIKKERKQTNKKRKKTNLQRKK